MRFEKIYYYSKKCPAILSILYSSIILCIMLLLDGVKWEGTDDFSMSQLLMGTAGVATPYACFISYFLGMIIIFLQKIAPIINWFSALEMLSVWFSFAIMQWMLLKYSRKSNEWTAFVFGALCEPLFLLNLQYTRSAFLLSFAGVILIYDSCFGKLHINDEHIQETPPFWINLIKILLGIIAFIFGSFFRFECMHGSVAYIMIFVFSFLLSGYKTHDLRYCIRRAMVFMCILVIAYFGVYFFRYLHIVEYNRWYDTNNFHQLNNARYSVVDYMPPRYYVEFCSGDFCISENDFYMLKCYVCNDDLFSIEYYNKVRGCFDSTSENSSSENASYNFKQLFKYRSGRYSGTRSTFALCTIVFVLAFLMCRKKDCILILLDAFGTIVFLLYFLSGNRLPPWVADPIYLLAIFVLFIIISTNELKELCEKKSLLHNYIFLGVIVTVCFFERTSVFYREIRTSWKNEDLTKLIDYAEQSEDVFLLDNISNCPYPYIDVYGALANYTEGQWQNIIRVGNWDVGHPSRNIQKESLGIDSVIYSLSEGKSYLITTSDMSTYHMYKMFFLEHYDLYVSFQTVMEFGDYSIVKVVPSSKIRTARFGSSSKNVEAY